MAFQQGKWKERPERQRGDCTVVGLTNFEHSGTLFICMCTLVRIRKGYMMLAIMHIGCYHWAS